MIQIKKTILTLVALLAVTTGAWADETLLLTIESKDHFTFKSGSKTFDDKVTINFSNSVYNDGDTDGWYSEGTASLLTVTGTNGYTITSCKFYTNNGPANTGYTVEGESPSVYLYGGKVYIDDSKSVSIGTYGVTKIEVYTAAASVASDVTVDWNKTSKTGSFKMPGGNVELEPEYYTQATAAEGAVTAATGVAATTEDALVTIDETKLTGAAKMMYYVSTEATAPAYDAEGWTDVLPTAEKYTEAANLNVWYYPVGTDEGVGGATATYSDGDMNTTALAVTIAAAPTYNVEFAEGTNPEAPAEPIWTATPNTGVKKGTEVTVTYTGSKKVLGVKAEKKAAAEGHALPLAKFGEIVCSDGKAYAAADKDNLPKGVKAEALVCYVNGEHGLALAMADVKNAKMSWDNDRGANDGKTAAEWCDGWNTSHPIAGATWLLASQTQWNNMISAAGSASNLSNAFSAVGGTNLQAWSYWSSTPNHGGSAAYLYYFPSSSWQWVYLNGVGDNGCYIRACLEW